MFRAAAILALIVAACLCGVSAGVAGASDQAAAQGGNQAVPAPQREAGAPIPVEFFGELPFMEYPQLSPDGKKVALEVAVKGEQHFAIASVEGPRKTVLLNEGDLDLQDWSWVNNDWLIATVGAVREVEDESWYLTRTLAVNADGKTTMFLGKDTAGQNASDVLWQATDGSPHILLAMQTSVYQGDDGLWSEVRDFDVSTGKSKLVAPSTDKVENWYADGTGNVRIGIAYDDASGTSRMLYRDRQGQSFRTVSRARGPKHALGNIPAMFLPEPGKALAFDDDADGFTSLYNFDLASLKTGDKLFGVPGYDLDRIIAAEGGTKLIGVRYIDDRPRTHWFDPKLAEVQSQIDAAVGTRQAQIVSWSRDFSVLVVLVGGADRPGGYYIYYPAEGVMHLLGNINQDLGAGAQSPVSTIRYKARDGLEMRAILTLPRGRDPKKLPLIMMPHGGPIARDDESWDWWAQFLASRGYAVLQPNYRGSSGFGTEFIEKGRGQWGLAMQDDLVDAVKWAADQGIADPGRVCIVGASYGGYAALRAAQRDHGAYRCAVSYAGVSDLQGMLRYDSGFLNDARSSRDYWHARTADLKSVSPVNSAADFSIPVLIMHGKADLRVPVKQSRQMAERLKAAGKVYRYVEQPLGDHHFTREADRVQFLREMEAFLAHYNPA